MKEEKQYISYPISQMKFAIVGFMVIFLTLSLVTLGDYFDETVKSITQLIQFFVVLSLTTYLAIPYLSQSSRKDTFFTIGRTSALLVGSALIFLYFMYFADFTFEGAAIASIVWFAILFIGQFSVYKKQSLKNT